MISTTLALAAFSALLFEVTFVSALSVGESCTDAPEECEAPLSCVGNPTNLRCFMKKGLNMACGKDPFWVCEDGLMCDDGICRRAIRAAGACNAVEEACVSPLSCVGNLGNRKCFMKKGLNMTCGKDPFWVCEDGLMCDDGICRRAIRAAGACNAVEEACVPPLSCVGNLGNRRCFMKKGLNMACGKDPFWVCEEGLMCIDGICKRPVGRRGACNDPDTGCRRPFSCLGSPGNKRCFKKKFRGMRCNQDPFWVCHDRLVCDAGICKRRVGIRRRCGANFRICEAPLSCVGTPELKRCMMKKGLGMVCGRDPFWVCEDGLECVDFECRAT